MTITLAFVVTVALILCAGTAIRRWDESHHQRFTDEAGTGRAVTALARVEARRLAAHPAFLITLGFVGAVTAVLLVPEQNATIEADRVEFFTFIGVPVGALALVVAAHRNAGRSRREATDELFASTPTAPRARTEAFLLACLGPVPIAFAYLLVARVSLAAVLDAPVPLLWPLLAGAAASILLAVIGGGVVGVLLSRWLPSTAAALAGTAAIIWLNNGPDNHHERFRWLRVAVEKDLGGRFDIAPSPLWRVTFIAGLVGLGACLALWRHPARRSLVIATTSCVAVVAASGWIMTRPPSALQVERVVADLESPTTRQHCEERRRVRYCVYPGAEGWIDTWSPAVDAVLAALPEPARPEHLQVLQRESVPRLEAPVEFNGDLSYPYLEQVVGRVDPATAWRADGAVHPSLQLDDDQPDLEVAFGVASLAVGLPPASTWTSPAGCFVPGQARLVLAMWLAGGATDTTRHALSTHAARVEDEELVEQRVSLNTIADYEDRSASGDGHQAVVGAAGTGADVLVAQRLVQADGAEVTAAVREHWDELTDPATPSGRLLELAGLSPPEAGTAAPAAPGTCS
jgi:hypothetical protein